ncbi:MAG: hypothetical protein C0519_00545 [Hyphomicrobium sp.]|nr:hypothetical protein [Hyphomicrobium sp.]PPD08023.1 MAG: hypothetical protein CTY28_07015 [Hyphomicrobium sp.]
MFDLIESQAIELEATAFDSEPVRTRLSYEDQLYVWVTLIRLNMAGKIAPAHQHDRRTPVEYGITAPEHLCLREFNHVSDLGPITINQLKATAKTFRYLEPPFPSFPPDSKHYRIKGKKGRNKQSTGNSTL